MSPTRSVRGFLLALKVFVKRTSTLWWPSRFGAGKHNQLLSLDAENLFIWDLKTEQRVAKVQARLSAGELHHIAGGAWNPHDVTKVATTIESSVQLWDLRSMK